MKKRFLGTIIVLTISATAMFSIENSEAKTEPGDQMFGKVQETQCVLYGEVVGYSNNCIMGKGSCIDREC